MKKIFKKSDIEGVGSKWSKINTIILIIIAVHLFLSSIFHNELIKLGYLVCNLVIGFIILILFILTLLLDYYSKKRRKNNKSN